MFGEFEGMNVAVFVDKLQPGRARNGPLRMMRRMSTSRIGEVY
jgi:hypothetical protein